MLPSPLPAAPGSVRSQLRASFSTDHPPHLIGASFALGLFLVALPNLGLSLVLLAGIGYLFEWANTLALSAAALVLNPVVKGGVYLSSIVLGSVILGPAPGIAEGNVSLAAGQAVVIRLLVGNVLVAAAVATVGFLVAIYGVTAVRG